jgi:hypothetical protein
MDTIGIGRVLVHGSFAPNGSSALVAANVNGKGFSVARTSQGLFTVTFDNAYPELVSAICAVQNASSAPAAVQIGDYVAASKTLQIYARSNAGGTGIVPLNFASAREIASNDIQNLAAHGGILASDSVPSLSRVNAATDKALRLAWAATEQDEIQFEPFVKPPDMDSASDLTVHLMLAKDANTDTAAVVDVQAWDGVGDTEMGGNTGALDTASLAEYTVTIANANVAAAPGFINFGLVPGAHANDAIYCYAAWVEYTKAAELVDLAADDNTRISFECIFRNTSVDY